jgi:hypothetical protein
MGLLRHFLFFLFFPLASGCEEAFLPFSTLLNNCLSLLHRRLQLPRRLFVLPNLIAPSVRFNHTLLISNTSRSEEGNIASEARLGHLELYPG